MSLVDQDGHASGLDPIRENPIRTAVMAQIVAVAAQQRKALCDLADELPLLDSGLDSLCLALIIAGLEDDLGLDPLSSDNLPKFPVTIGELVGMYERAALRSHIKRS